MGTPSEELDSARLRAIAASDRPLAPHECAERARMAAGAPGSTGAGPAKTAYVR
jgi:hypothetical protein